MAKHIGESHTIKRVNKGWDDGRISYGLNDIVCQWDERGLEAVKDEQKIVITTDGKTTTARMFEGKKLIKSAEAKCHPDDGFDFETGAKVAFDRLVEREEKVKPKELLKNGVFGRSKNFGWFVVVGNKFVFEKTGYASIDSYDEELIAGVYSTDEIEVIVNAKSFDGAKQEKDIIWRRHNEAK